MQDDAHDIKPDGGPCHLGEEEKRSPCLIRPLSEPTVEIRINRGETVFVIDWQQQKSNSKISKDES